MGNLNESENPLHHITGLESASGLGIVNNFLHLVFQSQTSLSRLSTCVTCALLRILDVYGLSVVDLVADWTSFTDL